MSKKKVKPTNKEIWELILASYRATWPYVLTFIVLMFLTTYLVTELLFR